MTEVNNQATSILLPTSSVAVYSKDNETLEAARHAANDWRFARVNVVVEDGDINTAIQAYQDASAPDLIIIQTEDMGDSLTAQLEQLAGCCSEDTAAIVIGPLNDVNLYRKLIDMGVSDYLVKPISADAMADVIARTLVDRLGVTGSRLIAFVGAKGGVGTSVLAQAAAWGVSDILKQKAVIIDGAGGWSTMSVGLGFEPSTTLAEAAKAAAEFGFSLNDIAETAAPLPKKKKTKKPTPDKSKDTKKPDPKPDAKKDAMDRNDVASPRDEPKEEPKEDEKDEELKEEPEDRPALPDDSASEENGDEAEGGGEGEPEVGGGEGEGQGEGEVADSAGEGDQAEPRGD